MIVRQIKEVGGLFIPHYIGASTNYWRDDISRWISVKVSLFLLNLVCKPLSQSPLSWSTEPDLI
jgi:hypothetical protein